MDLEGVGGIFLLQSCQNQVGLNAGEFGAAGAYCNGLFGFIGGRG
jgi:hypothetical protein